jgi:hypothetical protein
VQPSFETALMRLLRMRALLVADSIFKQPDTLPRSRHANAPEFCINHSRHHRKEGAGNAGCPMHPWFRAKKHEVVTTGSPVSTRHSLHNGFTVSFVLSSVTGLLSPSPRGKFRKT